MKKDKEYTQRFIETMLRDKKLQIETCEGELSKRTEDKTKIIEILQKKQDESKRKLSDRIIEYEKMLCEELDAFAKGEDTLTPLELLKEYMYEKSLDGDDSDIVDEKAQCLFKHFLKTEDVLSASTFLKCRSGSEFTTKYDEQREMYLEHMAKHPQPLKSSEVDCIDTDCIMGYGEYKDDIVKLFRVCGQIDFKTKPKGHKGIYYSETTKQLLARASIGEFGKVCRHVYYDMPYGFGICDSDRRMLMDAHDRGYEIEQSVEKLAKERSL